MNLGQLLPFLLIAVLIVPMVLMSRKQKRAMAQQQELQNSIEVGDKVMTTSGLYGYVANTADDATVDIEIADGVVTTWLRAAVREKVSDDVVEEPVEDDEPVAEAVETKDEEKSVVSETPKSTAEVAPPLEQTKKS
ncbi:preprotein translocase subunit YajC [Kibdelosporangium phytohabitans]|uniref:Preprotein translocase subunit YajC n=1 Tax=Kibdelosporangium phytohabitans TaxID=860235 RepID=A0A0N9IAF3_9PSEU|nr:preprotein translocase subunit YajC [Kibdelosporangium phytohabitans]ALG11730.1 preprotein translocase subunit YajC [Kibdelosporangium phytohabitans]MBE1463131.1 preprotein translocase subunit YajC [Kibdelosporangium phytohabitans]